MSIIHSLLPQSLQGSNGNAPQVAIKLESPLPPFNGNQPLTATVSKSNLNGQLLLTLPNGQEIAATTTPALPVGTKLSLSPQSATPPASTPAATPGTPASVTVRITLPSGLALPPQTLQPQPANASGQILLQTAENIQNTIKPPATLTLPTATTAENTLTSNTLPAITLNLANLSAKNIQTALQHIPLTQQSMAEGPLDYTFTQQNRQSPPLQQPLTLTLQTPASGRIVVGGQALTLTFATPLQLPTGQPIPVTFAPNTNQPQQPVLLLTQAMATSQQPQALPATPVQLSALKAILSPGQAAEVPLGTPIAARVLSQPEQGLLLATGHRAVLQSPQPLTAGSVVVVEFPVVTGPGQIIRVQQSGQQALPPQTQQTAATVPAQTPAIPLGTTLQGTVSGQNAQGQPLLTISSPSTFAGQTLPLNLPAENQHHLPIGSKLTLQMGAEGMATVLELTLPAAAQRANTLTHLGQQWPALQQALNLLAAQAPGTAQSMRSQLPQLAALLPGLLNFTEALRRNDPDTAFGKEAQTMLKALGVDLTPDFQHLSQLQQRQDDTQWRGMVFPYLENPQDNPRQGGFFWRREKKDEARSSTSTRFIMEMSLSQMGEVQLDGLITYPDVWLKLRRTTLPEDGFVTQLQNLVTSTLAQYGLTGGITVETTATFPVSPLAEVLATTPNPLPTSA